MINKLNEYGEMGWELVKILPSPNDDDGFPCYRFLLKREWSVGNTLHCCNKRFEYVKILEAG